MEHTLHIGEKLPEITFSAYNPQTDSEESVSISALLGKWTVFLFYPADFTFVCPTELEEMASLYSEFEREGADVISVSTDTVFVHKAWHDHSPAIKKVKYRMAADPTGTLSKLFGVYIQDEGLSLRGTFIVDPDLCLKTIEIHDNAIGRSAKESLRKLRAAKFVREHGGNVCPAAWEPGSDTLEPGLDLVGKI